MLSRRCAGARGNLIGSFPTDSARADAFRTIVPLPTFRSATCHSRAGDRSGYGFDLA